MDIISKNFIRFLSFSLSALNWISSWDSNSLSFLRSSRSLLNAIIWLIRNSSLSSLAPFFSASSSSCCSCIGEMFDEERESCSVFIIVFLKLTQRAPNLGGEAGGQCLPLDTLLSSLFKGKVLYCYQMLL